MFFLMHTARRMFNRESLHKESGFHPVEGHLQQPLGNPSAGEKCGSRSVLLEGTSGGEKPQGSQRKGNGDPTLQRSFIQPYLILNLAACGNFGVIV